MINKIHPSVETAVADIADGATIHIGGFAGAVGMPSTLIRAVAELGPRDLTVVSAGAGRATADIERFRKHAGPIVDGEEIRGFALSRPPGYCDAGAWVERRMVSHMITSYSSEPRSSRPDFPIAQQVIDGDVTVELVALGTLAERVRAAQAGIPAFYCPVGAGTEFATGKEQRDIGGVPCVLETALFADFALLRASRGDRFGNLSFDSATATLHTSMAGAARVTIAEVGELVEGALPPNEIDVAGVFVDRITLGSPLSLDPLTWVLPTEVDA